MVEEHPPRQFARRDPYCSVFIGGIDNGIRQDLPLPFQATLDRHRWDLNYLGQSLRRQLTVLLGGSRMVTVRGSLQGHRWSRHSGFQGAFSRCESGNGALYSKAQRFIERSGEQLI